MKLNTSSFDQANDVSGYCALQRASKEGFDCVRQEVGGGRREQGGRSQKAGGVRRGWGLEAGGWRLEGVGGWQESGSGVGGGDRRQEAWIRDGRQESGGRKLMPQMLRMLSGSLIEAVFQSEQPWGQEHRTDIKMIRTPPKAWLAIMTFDSVCKMVLWDKN